MRESCLAFESSTDLVDELMQRETFRGVVVHLAGGPNNQDSGANAEVRVEISPGLSNEQAGELLAEVHRALTQFVAGPLHGS